MTGEGFFLDISKIAVIFAGFASVVGALRHPRNEGWTKRDVVGLKFMIEHSAAAIIIGLLPFPIFYYFSDETIAWAICSCLLAGFLIVELLAHIKRIKDISLSGFPPRRFGLMISTLCTRSSNNLLSGTERHFMAQAHYPGRGMQSCCFFGALCSSTCSYWL
jgi:hypothetical protein